MHTATNDKIPKALIRVRELPFIDHQLRWLASHGVDDVLLSIGHLGKLLRDHVKDGAPFGLRVRYVDEGEDLRGTAGALRLALDSGLLEDHFLVTYGDSYLPVDFGELAHLFNRSGRPAMMTVFRNDGRWDRSNVIVDGDRVTLYDKHRKSSATNAPMEYIDFGLLAMRRSVIAERVASGTPADLAELLHELSLEGQLAAHEVKTRFYEIGSPQGLADLEQFLGTLAGSPTVPLS
jgi:NDP-sugar pyrophosphorylase family protein